MISAHELEPAAVDAKAEVLLDPSVLASVTVTYNPDLAVLERQLRGLPPTTMKVVVDNASDPVMNDGLRGVVEACDAFLLQNPSNDGLPAAQNRGCRYAHDTNPACRYLLLLDQDSEPEPGGVERLLQRYSDAATQHGGLCCIGPRLVDAGTGLQHGFHQIRGWRWLRHYPAKDTHALIPVANLNGSGTLMPYALFEQLGGLEEDFFIDHVDTEWAFRVLAAGYGLYGVSDVSFQHRMGHKSLRFWWFGWRVWPYRTPLRHFYLFRNAARLLRRSYVPIVWKVWAVAKLAVTISVHVLVDPARMQQVRAMLKGLRAAAHGERATNGVRS